MPESEVNYFVHLGELRNRVAVALVAIGIATVACFFYSDALIEFITAPIRTSISKLYFFSPYEAFLMKLKVAVTSAIILSAPFLFFLLWSFVSPGLYPREQKMILPVALFSSLLFLAGTAFAHFCVIPFALKFFLGFQTETLRPLISIGEYVSFFLSLILIFGSVFVVPVVLVGLIHFRILSACFLAKQRKAVIVIVFIVSAVLTPTMDIVTQCFMAVPLWLLFEFSVWIGKQMEQKRGQTPSHNKEQGA